MTESEPGDRIGRHVKRKHGLTRSKSGCLTCRKRRKKCDVQLPICGHCARLSLQCQWPCTSDHAPKLPRPQGARRVRARMSPESSLGCSTDSRGAFESKDAEVNTPWACSEFDKNFKMHQAADALLNPRDLDSERAGVQHYDSSHDLESSTCELECSILPTQEDIEAAQWLSRYRGNKTNHELHDDELMVNEIDYHDALQPTFALVTPRSTGSLEDVPSPPFNRFSPQHTDDNSGILLDYFETELAQMISVAPRECNNLLRILMPMAQSHAGVRSAIAAWSATHLRDIDDKFTAQSHHYLGEAVSWLDNATSDPDEQDRDTTLAVALIICAVEVCKDADSEWSRYRNIAHDIIRRRDLVNSYTEGNQVFLLKFFAYHDVMSASPPHHVGSTLAHLESQIILASIPNLDGPDVYMGICSALYRIISEITSLASKLHVERWSSKTIAMHASRLVVSIDACEPLPQDLIHIPPDDQPKHLIMFNILQCTTKLYINQVLLHYAPDSPESVILLRSVLPLFSSLQTVLVEMLFPLFIVGVDSMSDDRRKVGRMLELMFDSYRFGNIRCAYTVLEKCWESNESGARYVDWNEVSWGLFGQCTSFA